jgi:hypothetical protein
MYLKLDSSSNTKEHNIIIMAKIEVYNETRFIICVIPVSLFFIRYWGFGVSFFQRSRMG